VKDEMLKIENVKKNAKINHAIISEGIKLAHTV
jgi:hypothetical protein